MQFTVIKPHTNLPFMELRKIAFFILGALIIAAIALTATKGPSWGTSFEGGTSITIRFAQPIDIDRVRQGFGGTQTAGEDAQAANSGALQFGSVNVQQIGSDTDNSFVVRTRTTTLLDCQKLADVRAKFDAAVAKEQGGTFVVGQWPSCNAEAEDGIRGDFFVSLVAPEGQKVPETIPEAAEIQKMLEDSGLRSHVSYENGSKHYLVKPTGIQDAVVSLLSAKFADSLDTSKCANPSDTQACLSAAALASIDQIDTVGADVGEKFRTDSIVSILVALLLMLLYIAIRFDIRYAPAAVISLMVTTVISWGFVVALGIEITLETVAAFLSLVGYGINDTIVTFDRVRENVALSEADVPLKSIVNKSINECLSRTIITSITTLIAIIPMAVLATGATKDFSIIMTIGICIATVNSIFVSCPMLLVFDKIIKDKQKRDQERRELAELNAQI